MGGSGVGDEAGQIDNNTIILDTLDQRTLGQLFVVLEESIAACCSLLHFLRHAIEEPSEQETWRTRSLLVVALGFLVDADGQPFPHPYSLSEGGPIGRLHGSCCCGYGMNIRRCSEP